MMTIQCRVFAGGVSTDRIASGSFTSTTQRSLACWFNMAAFDGVNTISKWEPVSGLNEILQWDTNGLNYWSGWTNANGDWTIASPSLSVWHSLVVTYDGSATTNTPVVYLDGVSQSVTNRQVPVGTLQANNAQCFVGNMIGSNGPWNGSLSVYARWNAILSVADVTNLASGVPACAVQPQSLVLYYPLDHGESPEPDLVAGNNGTVTGTTVGTGPPAIVKARCRVFVSTHPMIGTAVGGPFFANPLG